jgi:hypothetical protein
VLHIKLLNVRAVEKPEELTKLVRHAVVHRKAPAPNPISTSVERES